jgi:hypothetical protein
VKNERNTTRGGFPIQAHLGVSKIENGWLEASSVALNWQKLSDFAFRAWRASRELTG